ncbi:ornithine decarboxylase, partial [Trichonephila inaurata madagascariensis]
LTQEIKASLEKNFPAEDIEIIAEPGCYCVASAFSLVTSIIGKKSIAHNGDNGIQREYYLNDGFYGSFPYFYKDYDVKHIPLLTSSEIKKIPKYKSKVWGQTCCCEDVILEECLLPDMEEGQLILWKNMGAYIRGVTSNFTLVPYPANRYIFIQNPRLKLDCIPNLTEVSDYIAEVANLIEQTEDMSRFSLDL